MTNKEILDIIVNKVKSMKEIENISLSDRFKEDLGFDSVDMLELVLFLEEQFKISFSHPFVVLTVEDALVFINSNVK